MAEVLAAFAVAGNILQFLQIGAEFVAKAYKINASKNDALVDLIDLRKTTIELRNISKDLEPKPNDTPHGKLREPPQELVSLARDCSSLIQDLLQSLAKVGHSSEIQRLKERIQDFRSRLAANRVISLREMAIQSTVQQANILSELKALRRDLTTPSPDQDMNMVGEITARRGYALGDIVVSLISGSLNQEGRQYETELLRADIKRQLRHLHQIGRFSLSKGETLQIPPERGEQLREEFMASLDYKERDERETAIPRPYQDTFQWIFPDSHRSEEPSSRKDHRFAQWLESSTHPLYWITGKAGSGKSTLMKYIADFQGGGDGAQTCLQHLEKWSGDDRKLVAVKFYFWVSGYKVQGSRRALLQSLLWQLLDRFPGLVVEIVAAFWDTLFLFGPSLALQWTEEDLYKLLLEVTKLLTMREGYKVCFFIDGLDEFEGDPVFLVQLTRQLLEIRNVKVCVSSRPWLVFQDSFGQAPNLLLQDLTSPDIKHFVVSSFNDDEGFRRLSIRQPLCAASLVDQITEKSSGVFLWVHLVTRSLLTGLSNDDRISDLKRRLDHLPTDLERLYARILHDLDPFYFEHASQYFKILLANEGSADALLVSFADEEDQNFAIQMPIRPISSEEKALRIQTLKRRLNSRCKGLLELGPSNKVGFLHRTVGDFVVDKDIIQRIDGATKDFDGSLELCSASFPMLKTSFHGAPQSVVQRWVTNCLSNAAKATRNITRMTRILDSLHGVIRQAENDDDLELIYRLFPDIKSISLRCDYRFGNNFLSLATRFGVAHYVRARALTGCMSEDDRLNPAPYSCSMKALNRSHIPKFIGRWHGKLHIGTVPSIEPEPGPGSQNCWRLLLDATCTKRPDARIFDFLLEHGADLNLVHRRDGATVWAEIIAAALAVGFADEIRDDFWAEWASVLRLCMKYGAKIGRYLIDLALLRLHWFVPGGLTARERIYVILDCVANNMDDLAVDYLRGDKDVANYKWEKKNYKKPTSGLKE